MANKIIQMWEESSHTTALYPTSVAEAIKWDSSTTVAQKIASVEDKAGLVGIDTSRVIATNPTSPYIATEDCFATIYLSTNNGIGYYSTVYVDGVLVSKLANTNSGYVAKTHIIPLKKDQSLIRRRGNNGDSRDSIDNSETIVYGVKH